MACRSFLLALLNADPVDQGCIGGSGSYSPDLHSLLLQSRQEISPQGSLCSLTMPKYHVGVELLALPHIELSGASLLQVTDHRLLSLSDSRSSRRKYSSAMAYIDEDLLKLNFEDVRSWRSRTNRQCAETFYVLAPCISMTLQPLDESSA